jgi:hypothetical protein
MSKHDPNEAIRISNKEPVAMTDYKTKDPNWINPKIPPGPSKKQYIETVCNKHSKLLWTLTEQQEIAIRVYMKAVLAEVL